MSLEGAIFVAYIRHLLLEEKVDEGIIDLARFAMKRYKRDDLPDWIEALANVNILNQYAYSAGIEEVRSFMKAEEE